MFKLKYFLLFFLFLFFSISHADENLCNSVLEDGKNNFNAKKYKAAQECFEYVKDNCDLDSGDVNNWIKKCKEALKPKLKVSKSSISVSASKTTILISVESNVDWEVDKLSGEIYSIKRNKNALEIQIKENTTTYVRNDYFTIETLDGSIEKVIKIQQEAFKITPRLSVDKSLILCSPNDTSFSIKVSSNVDWEVDKQFGEMYSIVRDNNILKIQIFENTEITSRKDSFYVKSKDGVFVQKIRLEQEPIIPRLQIRNPIVECSDKDTVVDIVISANVNWHIDEGEDDMYEVVKNQKCVSVRILKNESTNTREAVLFVKTEIGKLEQAITLRQKGRPIEPMLYVNEDSISCSSRDTIIPIIVTSNVTWVIDKPFGNMYSVKINSDTLNVRIYANSTIYPREASFFIQTEDRGNGVLKQKVVLNQSAINSKLEVDKTLVSCSAKDTIVFVNVTSNVEWEIDKLTSKMYSISKRDNGFSLRIGANKSPFVREDKFNIKTIDNKCVAQISLQQSARKDYLTFNVKGIEFKMVYVEGGTMLSDYYIGETEVTQALWKAVMGNNPSKFKGANKPVDNVDYFDCIKFISELNYLTGQRFALPTEAQWEFAAKGGNYSKGYKYVGSNNLDSVAWYNKKDYLGPLLPFASHDVALKKANELGLYDMLGNVYELCAHNSSQSSYFQMKGGSVSCPHYSLNITSKKDFSDFNWNKPVGFRLSLPPVKFTSEDYWFGFQKLVEASSIEDKAIILSVLSMYTDPQQREQEIKNIAVAYKAIAEEIIPELHRYKMISESYNNIVKRDTILLNLENFGEWFKSPNVKYDSKDVALRALSLYKDVEDQKKEILNLIEKVIQDENLLGQTNVYVVIDDSSKDLVYYINGVKFKMVYVKGDSFMMGDPKVNKNDFFRQLISHKVLLDDYYIGETEVTCDLWDAVMYNSKYQSDNEPIRRISWLESQFFLSKLSWLIGQRFSLPTEAQWEFAARGGIYSRGYMYAGSNNFDYVANMVTEISDVAKKKPNELGLYDMTGNVYEFCKDFYDEDYYKKSPRKNPTGATIVKYQPTSDDYKIVVRSGADESYYNWSRDWVYFYKKYLNVGLRLSLVKLK